MKDYHINIFYSEEDDGTTLPGLFVKHHCKLYVCFCW
jgi:hypothetical protein